MRQQILDIVNEIRSERNTESHAEEMRLSATLDCVLGIVQSACKMDGVELLAAIRDARTLMLDIILRLRDENPERTDRATELEADRFWDGSMREHFVEAAENLAAKPEIRDLYKEVHEEPDQPLNDFLNNLSGEVDQDLGYFVYTMLTNDAEKAEA